MITLKDKQFEVSIPNSTIIEKVEEVAEAINRDLSDKTPLFLSVLNGAFMFTGDLMKSIRGNCLVSFVKVSSYEGTASTGKVRELIGVGEEVRGRHVVIIEDIVDTGNTLNAIMESLKAYEPAAVKVATLLYKPDAYKGSHPVDYVAIEIPNDFVVGYGLDYDGLGRNLKDIYTLAGE